jgi:ribA/ribD-fused uncharacterized protein
MDLPLDLEDLRQQVAAGRVFRYRFFWGHRAREDGQLSDSVFSQWWLCRFELDGVTYVTAEQFMMASKARLFGDAGALEAILAEADPASCKKLGRQVRDYDEVRWAAARFDLVTRGNVAKFGQDVRLRQYLVDTGEDILVEASPRDCIWGIGLGRDSERARDPRTWRGKNLLGFALVRARATLIEAPGVAG